MTVHRLQLTVGGTSSVFGKSSLKHSKSFRIILSNQKLARASTSQSESNRASKYIMLHSNFRDENRRLSLISEAGFRHQLVLVPPTVNLQKRLVPAQMQESKDDKIESFTATSLAQAVSFPQ